MKDITRPANVEVQIRADGTVLWVNVDGECALRCCKIGSITVRDERKPAMPFNKVIDKEVIDGLHTLLKHGGETEAIYSMIVLLEQLEKKIDDNQLGNIDHHDYS